MKFRAKIVDANYMRQFSNLINILYKLSKTFVFRICDDILYFWAYEQNDQIKLWCTFDSQFFESYAMNGTDDKDEIQLEVPSDMMSSILNSLKTGSSVTSMDIKLSGKSSPCLKFALELVNQMCIHDVPVIVIPPADWTEFKDLSDTEFDVSIEMPNIKMLHNALERLKKINSKITVSAKKSPRGFSLSVEATTAAIEVLFTDLQVRYINEDNTEGAYVSIDIKKFSQFLACAPNNATVSICKIKSNCMLHVYMENTAFKLNYYISALDD